jgi:hypothetical protein
MKKLIYAFFILNSISFFAQATRVGFGYDNEGNQTSRTICIGCRPATVKDSTITSAIIAAEDMIPAEDDIVQDGTTRPVSYYPNPVREELYLKWVNEESIYVVRIELYSPTGQSLQQYANLQGSDTKTIHFHNYPSGLYNVVLLYNNSEKKTLKILKQ